MRGTHWVHECGVGKEAGLMASEQLYLTEVSHSLTDTTFGENLIKIKNRGNKRKNG